MFNIFNETREGQRDTRLERGAPLAADHGRQVLDEGHPRSASAVLAGADPWLIARGVALLAPIIGYVVFAIITVLFAIKIGDVGVHQHMTFQMKFYFYHGMAVILTVTLAAAGSFIIFFALQMRGVLGGTL